jgi:glycerol-1-phosphate dehydrogenase [NAD(P)+]
MRIEGNTNVRSERFGAGSIEGLGDELGNFIVTTMPVPWQLAQPRLGRAPTAVVMVESMEVDVLDRQLAELPVCDTFVGIGGGQAIDMAKYFAWKRGKRLVSIPTVLSVDAFVTPAAGVRRNHTVEYLGTSSPDPLVIDYDLVRTAPADLNIAGVGDLLSIHTATYDWCLAEQAGKSEFPFSQPDVDAARAILADTMALANEIRRCTDAGLQAIVDGYLRINTLCLPAGHYRVEEGSEHYLFYELEERLKRPFIHGHIVGLGVYLLSRLQESEPDKVTSFMHEVGLKYQPADMGIRRDDLLQSLRNLREYVRSRQHLWYTVINEREMDSVWIEAAIADLKF